MMILGCFLFLIFISSIENYTYYYLLKSILIGDCLLLFDCDFNDACDYYPWDY